jgi:hypothetical protein
MYRILLQRSASPQEFGNAVNSLEDGSKSRRQFTEELMASVEFQCLHEFLFKHAGCSGSSAKNL